MAVAFLPVFYAKLALNDVPTLVPVELALWASAGILKGWRRRTTRSPAWRSASRRRRSTPAGS
jgi:hypothetical protein